MNDNTQQKIWTKSFISISMTQFMVFTIFYALITTLPIYIIHDLGKSEAQGGLIVTVMLLAAILIRPFSAKILDLLGKKKGLILSVATFTVTTFLYIWIDQFTPLLVLRFVHGLSFGIITTATGAIAADIIPAHRRGAGLGYFAMSTNLAVVVGPFIGLTLLQLVSFQTLFIILSILMISGILLSIIVQVPAQSIVHQKTVKQKFTLNDLIEIKALPIALIFGVVGVAYASILSFISVYAEALDLSAAASYFFLIFAAVMLLSRPYIGRAFDTHGPKFVIIPSLIMFALGLFMLSFTSAAWMLLLAAGLIGLGYGSLLPSFQTMAVQSAPNNRSGYATATFYMLYDTGIAAGSLLWGLIVSGFGYQALYLACALIIIGVVGLFSLYLSRKPNHVKAQKQVYKELHSSNE